jgi:thymidylate synthase
MELYVRNVNGALYDIVASLKHQIANPDRIQEWELQSSRNGDTWEAIEPVVTVYERPMERVLFNQERDANPFFHFFESLWMLAGRRDTKFVVELVKRMADYSDNGRDMQGAYGWRWRRAWGYDQLAILTDLLRSKPDTRRAVLQMWDPDRDVMGQDFGNSEVGGLNSKDIPCNTCAYFKIRNGKLNLTVCCRSNDAIFGAYGANAVHMSFLLEYMAACVGVSTGVYRQVSDSLHLYTSGPQGDIWQRLQASHGSDTGDAYAHGAVSALPMFGYGELASWDMDLNTFFKEYDYGDPAKASFLHPWWKTVAQPMWVAYKRRDKSAAEQVLATDWRKAAVEWLRRREESK